MSSRTRATPHSCRIESLMGRSGGQRRASLGGYAGSYRASRWCSSCRAIRPVHSAQTPGIVNGFLPPASEKAGKAPNDLQESRRSSPPPDRVLQLVGERRCPSRRQAAAFPSVACSPLRRRARVPLSPNPGRAPQHRSGLSGSVRRRGARGSPPAWSRCSHSRDRV